METLAQLLTRAPRFDSIAHAVWWLRWHAGYDVRSITRHVEPLTGYCRETEHTEIHLAAVYSLAEQLYRAQNIDGV